jgi:hypothetical protein
VFASNHASVWLLTRPVELDRTAVTEHRNLDTDTDTAATTATAAAGARLVHLEYVILLLRLSG